MTYLDTVRVSVRTQDRFAYRRESVALIQRFITPANVARFGQTMLLRITIATISDALFLEERKQVDRGSYPSLRRFCAISQASACTHVLGVQRSAKNKIQALPDSCGTT